MMPTIRVEDDVFEGLKSLAEPFTDTPNSVIRRLLERNGVTLGKSVSKPSQEATHKHLSIDGQSLLIGHGELTPQPIYETFLVHVLATQFNGCASKQDSTKAVIQLMKSKGFINSADLERVSTGETKAENTVAWGRNALKDAGLISRNSQRGIWELTPEGLEKSKSINLPTTKNQ